MPASAASNVPLTEEKRTLTVRGSRGGRRRHAADRTTQAALLVTTRGLFMMPNIPGGKRGGTLRSTPPRTRAPNPNPSTLNPEPKTLQMGFRPKPKPIQSFAFK